MQNFSRTMLLALICSLTVATTSVTAKIVELSDRVKKNMSQSDFSTMIKEGNVVVKFYAEWCGPCRSLAETVKKIDKDFPSITWINVNIDQFEAIRNAYGVKSIPTVIYFKNGTQVDKETGAKSEGALRKKLQTLYA